MFVVYDMSRFLSEFPERIAARLGHRFTDNATVRQRADVILHTEVITGGRMSDDDWERLWDVVAKSDGLVILASDAGHPLPSLGAYETISAVSLFFYVGSTLCCYDIVDRHGFTERTGDVGESADGASSLVYAVSVGSRS